MEYVNVRRKFVELSGRYDLVNSDWTDNGADFFINAGQQLLDRMQNTGKSQAKNVQLITVGTIKVYISGLRSVLNVWIGNSTDGLIELKKCDVKYLRSLYSMQLSSVDTGTPEWYAPVSFRPFIDTETTTSLSGFYDVDDLILPTAGTPLHYTNTGILIMPAPDTSMYVSTYGLYYSPTLSASFGTTLTSGTLTVGTTYSITDWITDDSFTNVGGTNVEGTIFTATGTTPTHWVHSSILKPWVQTKSFWAESFPDTLIQASLLKLETFYRNSEGVKDWEAAVNRDMLGFDKDAVEEEISGISEMGG